MRADPYSENFVKEFVKSSHKELSKKMLAFNSLLALHQELVEHYSLIKYEITEQRMDGNQSTIDNIFDHMDMGEIADLTPREFLMRLLYTRKYVVSAIIWSLYPYNYYNHLRNCGNYEKIESALHTLFLLPLMLTGEMILIERAPKKKFKKIGKFMVGELGISCSKYELINRMMKKKYRSILEILDLKKQKLNSCRYNVVESTSRLLGSDYEDNLEKYNIFKPDNLAWYLAIMSNALYLKENEDLFSGVIDPSFNIPLDTFSKINQDILDDRIHLLRSYAIDHRILRTDSELMNEFYFGSDKEYNARVNTMLEVFERKVGFKHNPTDDEMENAMAATLSHLENLEDNFDWPSLPFSGELMAWSVGKLGLLHEIREHRNEYQIQLIVEIASLESVVSLMLFVLSADSDPQDPKLKDIIHTDSKLITWPDLERFMILRDHTSIDSNVLWKEKLLKLDDKEIDHLCKMLITELGQYIMHYTSAIGWKSHEVELHIPTKIYSQQFLSINDPDQPNLYQLPDKWRMNFGERLLSLLGKYLEKTEYQILEITE